jgi:multicomponent Na+:H+ antiporter subunit D
MKIAMLTTSALCILIGIFPQVFYQFLPYPMSYEPYTVQHIMDTLAIFSFTGLVFVIFLKKLEPKPYINLDLDWFYRIGAKGFMKTMDLTVAKAEYDFINIQWKKLMDNLVIPVSKKSAKYEDLRMNRIPMFISNLAKTLSDGIAQFGTGKVQDYAFYMFGFLGLVILILLLF